MFGCGSVVPLYEKVPVAQPHKTYYEKMLVYIHYAWALQTYFKLY